MTRNIARAMIILSAVLWGTSFPVIRMGLQYISPILFLFLRFSLATMILLIVLFAKGVRPGLRDIGGLVGLTGVLNAVAYALQFVGQKFTYATNAALMINTSPIFTAIFAHFLLEEKLTKPRAGAIILTFLGASIVILGSSSALKLRVIGDIICMAAGAIWGLYVAEAKRLREKGIDELELLFIWFLFVAILGGVASPLEKPRILLNIQAIFAVVYTAIMCTVLPFLLWYKALRSLEASSSSNYFMLEIVVSALAEAIFLGLDINMLMVLGAILIVVGVYLTDYFYREGGIAYQCRK